MCNINRRTVYIVIRDHSITGDLLQCAKQIAWTLDQPEARGTVKEVLDKLLRSGDIEFHGAVLRGISPEERKEEKKRKALEVQRRRRDRRRTAAQRGAKKQRPHWREPAVRDPEWDPEEATLSEQDYGFWCACTMAPHSPIGGGASSVPGHHPGINTY